jgi:hypothetical protein
MSARSGVARWLKSDAKAGLSASAPGTDASPKGVAKIGTTCGATSVMTAWLRVDL